jgi:ribosomal-protein-alanine N-acetyltransferase
VRLTRKEDVSQVTDIDHEAFSSWWPLTNYEHELENHMAHYIVAYDDSEKYVEEEPDGKGFSRITSKVKEIFNYNGAGGAPVPQDKIVGFAGFWIMAGEAHIISIAVKASYRGRGIGELILAHLIDLARSLGADVVTLEARVSNYIAQNLYLKYGFRKVGIRRGYYTDNREDAVIMTTDTITSVPYQSKLKRLKQEYTKKWGTQFPEPSLKPQSPP